MTETYTLDVLGNIYVSGTSFFNNTVSITNNSSTSLPSAISGTLILKKKTDKDIVSSIVFPSVKSKDDYGSIQYYDDVFGTNKNYFGQTAVSESACLYIGSENDNNSLYSSFRDTIVIRPVGGLILDVGTYEIDNNLMKQDLAGTIFMVPNDGNVSIGSIIPPKDGSKLFVDGNVSVSNVLGAKTLYSSGDISLTTDLTLVGVTPSISLTQNELSYLSGAKSNIQAQIDAINNVLMSYEMLSNVIPNA
jgi:hypothetical protein